MKKKTHPLDLIIWNCSVEHLCEIHINANIEEYCKGAVFKSVFDCSIRIHCKAAVKVSKEYWSIGYFMVSGLPHPLHGKLLSLCYFRVLSGKLDTDMFTLAFARRKEI